MKRTTDEPELNHRLANILKNDFGLNAIIQSNVGRGRRIDIEILIQSSNGVIRIALELEKYGKNKQIEAVKDVSTRLLTNPPLVDLGIALVYPKECISEEDINHDTKLSYLHVTPTNIKKFTRNDNYDYKKHLKKYKWKTITVKELPTYLLNLHKSAGAPELIAKNLKDTLDTIVNNLEINDMLTLTKSLEFNYEGKDSNEIKHIKRIKNGAKRALLVVAGATLFHTQLKHLKDHKPKNHNGEWPPLNIDQCMSSDNIRQDLIKAWELILKVDYKPIFESGITVLKICNGPKFAEGIYAIMCWASATADKVGGLRHDLLGRIFHRVLDTAKQDGSFYTSTTAAAFLAYLSIPDKQSLKNYYVIDPSCGTGTLLMAASERLRETSGNSYEPNILINDVIHGVDINTTACHMAATTLGLLSPKTNFDKMNMFATKLGIAENTISEYRAGSLELYSTDGLRPFMEWRGFAGTQIDTNEGTKETWHKKFNLVIMNPPFTRNSLRHDQFSSKVEKGIKKREEVLFKDASKGLHHSSGSMFILLAEKLLSKENGTGAFVLPMVIASSIGNQKIRVFLADKFYIETIVTSFDPTRVWFSENTGINEILLVVRRHNGKKKPNTKIIKLAVNPSSVAESIKYAKTLVRGKNITHCNIQQWNFEKIAKGDWTPTQFYSNYLTDLFIDIRDGKLFKICKLGDIADENVVPQGIRELFISSDNKPSLKESVEKTPWITKWTHKTGETTSMHAIPDQYLVRNKSVTKNMTDNKWEANASKAWTNGGKLHITEKVGLDLARVFAIRTDNKMIGSSWHTLVLKSNKLNTKSNESDIESDEYHIWSKAMTVYLNSTIGIIALLGVRTFKILSYPRWGVGNIKSITVPKFTDAQIKKLASIYDDYADEDLGKLKNPTHVRSELDRVVVQILNISEDIISNARLELSKEPMITGKQYQSETID